MEEKGKAFLLRLRGTDIRAANSEKAFELLISPFFANAEEISEKLTEELGSPANILNASEKRLNEIEGMTKSAAFFIANFYKLEKRIKKSAAGLNKRVFDINECKEYAIKMLKNLKKEEMWGFFYDGKKRLIEERLLGRGTVDGVAIDLTVISNDAIELDAKYVVLVHNHPSNKGSPSLYDLELTEQAYTCLKYLDIELIDHLITTRTSAFAIFKDGGLDKRKLESEFQKSRNSAI